MLFKLRYTNVRIIIVVINPKNERPYNIEVSLNC